jgi:hypothetical protein
MSRQTKVTSIAIVVIILAVVAVRAYTAQPTSDTLSPLYTNAELGFSIRVPQDYTTDASYRYQLRGPGHDIPGVKFTIPEGVATGTNLASDTYLSVEKLPQTVNCSAAAFLDQGVIAHAISEAGANYSVASTTGAGAGNRYEETVYALPGSPCLAVRYFIHYGVIENYPPGLVREFDEGALTAQFDAIRRTLTVTQ